MIKFIYDLGYGGQYCLSVHYLFAANYHKIKKIKSFVTNQYIETRDCILFLDSFESSTDSVCDKLHGESQLLATDAGLFDVFTLWLSI